MTLGEALREATSLLAAAGNEDAQLEAEVLLRHALGMSREVLFARLQEEIDPPVQQAFAALIERRLAHEPTAYIVGHREFYGLDLTCSPAALIPRQETELLVEHAVAWLRRRLERGAWNQEPGRSPRPLIVDVGTGNGALAVALAVHLPQARVIAIDASRQALLLAQRNARAHSVAGRIAFVQGSLLAPLRGEFDMIVANLPYVPAATYARLPPEIREHEPEMALRAGRRGTALIEALLEQASALLSRRGLLLAEHGWNQGRRLRRCAEVHYSTAEIETRKDLAGLERMLVIERARLTPTCAPERVAVSGAYS